MVLIDHPMFLLQAKLEHEMTQEDGNEHDQQYT